jgi:menaquinone-dependent protoporphyrinogen IX oxidase
VTTGIAPTHCKDFAGKYRYSKYTVIQKMVINVKQFIMPLVVGTCFATQSL